METVRKLVKEEANADWLLGRGRGAETGAEKVVMVEGATASMVVLSLAMGVSGIIGVSRGSIGFTESRSIWTVPA